MNLSYFLSLKRPTKRVLMVITDVLSVPVALWLAFCMRLGVWFIPSAEYGPLFFSGAAIALPIFSYFGLYRTVVRYISSRSLWSVVKASVLAVLIWSLLVFLFFGDVAVPRSIPFIFGMLLVMLVGGARLVAFWLLTRWYRHGTVMKRVLIYGAGDAGVVLANSLRRSHDLRIIGFLDDNPVLHGHEVAGFRVLGDRSIIDEFEGSLDGIEVLLAIPSLDRKKRAEIVRFLDERLVSVRTLPTMADLAQGKASLSDLHEIDIEDLLGRIPVEPNEDLLTSCIQGKHILVTGAGGSIGSELCRQILLLKPLSLVLLDHSEFNLYAIERELELLKENHKLPVRIVAVLGSVQNRERVDKVMARFSIHTVYHAAAFKHVPIVEHNIAEGVRNNVFGTLCVAESALANMVENFVLISTDKAVRPTNMMGATKRMAELILQALHEESLKSYSKKGHFTHFTMVRFGNVLGSSGSVIPLFRQQIAHGGPVTVTHPEITRYFMTIYEAAQLVIQAGSMGQGGDVFVLDMGEPVKILELAKRMIRLSGHRVLEDGEGGHGIAVAFTGLRKGEKLYEELLIGENATGTDHSMIMVAQEESFSWAKLSKGLKQLEQYLNQGDYSAVCALMQEFVSGYHPQSGVEDHLC